MDKETKQKNYPEQKNERNSAKVIEKKTVSDQELPASKLIPKIREFDRPVVKLEEALEAWKQYHQLINALIKEGDIIDVRGVKKAKKSGINKIARFFGYSCEIVRASKEIITSAEGKKGFVWKVWAKAIAPNGRFRVAGAACSSFERTFAHLEHDVLATAETRAKKRAIEELAGMGDLELEETENL